MKKIIISIIALLATCSAVYASDLNDNIKIETRPSDIDWDDEYYIDYNKHHISVQYGTANLVEIVNLFNVRPLNNGGLQFTPGHHWFSGTLGIAYENYLKPKFSLGIYLGVATSGVDMMDSSRKTVFENFIVSYTAMLDAHYIYYREGITELSSGLYLGVTYSDANAINYNPAYNGSFTPQDSGRALFTYHLTAIRARFGGNIGGFIELGLGYRGILQAGLSIRL